MRTIITRLGEFRMSRKDAVGFSVYKAGRQIGHGRSWVQAGNYFAVFHRRTDILAKPAIPRLYGGDFVARFNIDGSEIGDSMSTEEEEREAGAKMLLVQLGGRIESFEEWLRKFPGKAPASVTGEWSQSGNRVILHFIRRGERWGLFAQEQFRMKSTGRCTGARHEDDSILSLRPLPDCTLQVCMEALKLFPKLLEAIELEREAVKARVGEAILDYDRFAEQMGIPIPQD
jgi:hypothetical protein